jgi:general transcription factor 3C polypeptide 3 (transcription factor C subunit 4)
VELFLAAAETLRQYNHHAEALRFYEPLRNVAETLDAGFYFELAICYQALDRQEDVREAIEGIKHGDRSAGAQLGLAKLYHSQGKVELMWRVCAQMRRAGRSDLLRQAGLPTRKPLEVTSKPNRPFSVKNDGPREFRRGHILREEEEQHELLRDQVIRAMWDDLSPLEHPLVEPNPERNQEWLSIANELYQDFRSQIAFYPSDKNSPFTGYGRYKFSDTFDPNASSRENKLAYKLPTTYRKISFDDWTDFLMHFAIRLAEKGDRKKCSMVLKGAELANIINTDPKRYYLLRTVSLRTSPSSAVKDLLLTTL